MGNQADIPSFIKKDGYLALLAPESFPQRSGKFAKLLPAIGTDQIRWRVVQTL
jgi:hypothetical protein